MKLTSVSSSPKVDDRYTRFAINYRRMQKGITHDMQRAEEHLNLLQLDAQLLPNVEYAAPIWRGSEAQRIAREQIAAGTIAPFNDPNHKTPMEMWESNAAFQDFSLKRFRDNLRSERIKAHKVENDYYKKKRGSHKK